MPSTVMPDPFRWSKTAISPTFLPDAGWDERIALSHVRDRFPGRLLRV